jgi:hypothetical protein
MEDGMHQILLKWIQLGQCIVHGPKYRIILLNIRAILLPPDYVSSPYANFIIFWLASFPTTDPNC